MNNTCSSVWLVTREYAGVAEAGGVKNVACSLAEALLRKKIAVTVFIPRYGCVPQKGTYLFSSTVTVLGVEHPVSYISVTLHGVPLILIDSPIFFEKDDVYVYSDRETHIVHGAVRGHGHNDMDCMNLVHQRSVLEYARITVTAPDSIHCQDAHTALLPAIAQTDPRYNDLFTNTSFVVTIHNAGPGYRQLVPGIDRAVELTALNSAVLSSGMFNGNLEPFLLSAEYAHLTTVSPWYADELTSSVYSAMTEGLSAEFERRGTQIAGIVNGIDYHRYEPSDTKISLLPFDYNPISGDFAGKYRCREWFMDNFHLLAKEAGITCYGSLNSSEHAVYFTYQGRIVWQKGLDIFAEAAQQVMARLPEARFIVLGQGDPLLEDMLARLSESHQGTFLYLRGYERALARLSVAVADFIVLPSMFEPCGLEDYIGQIFSTLPVAHAVGGLQKILEGKNGFLYHSDLSGNSATILADRLTSLASPIIAAHGQGAAADPEYKRMLTFAANHVLTNCNWDSIVEHAYIPFYNSIFPVKS